jgi:HEAT repeat protein
LAVQIAGYLLELGPSVADSLVPHLKDPDASIRANTAVILGAIGSDPHGAALQTLAKDRDSDVVRAATRALERMKMRQAARSAGS